MEVPPDSDPDLYWKNVSSFYSSVMFASNEGSDWQIHKKYGIGKIDQILKVKEKYLPALSETKEEKDDFITPAEHNKFEERGDECFNSDDFPQATFWFFQHRMHNMGGQIYRNVEIANRNCGDEWAEFIPFLEKNEKEGLITASTEWADVLFMWQIDQKDFEAIGGKYFDDQDYPQATFWFFQHHMYNLSGRRYSNVDVALASACDEEDWDDFLDFLEEKHKNGVINETTLWPEVLTLWQIDQKLFEALGGRCFEEEDFPQATFWFFQHRLYNLEGEKYDNIEVSHARCGEDWDGFVTFLEQVNLDGSINESTTWSDIQGLWEPKAV